MRCAKSPDFVHIAIEHFHHQNSFLHYFILLIGTGTKSGDFVQRFRYLKRNTS